MLKNAIFFLFVSMIGGQAWSNCDAIVEEMGKEETPTTSFIALLQKMIENQQMSVDQYQMLINSIATGNPKLPWGEVYLSTHSSIRLFGNLVSDYLIYWRAHPDYLEKETVVKVGRENLKKWGREAVERSETKEETKIPMLKIASVKIPAGKLKLKDEHGKREVGLLQDAEVQRYVVTQAMWVEVMGENPSTFAKGEHEVTVNINGKNVAMQPNHPVERVNMYSAMVYANRLSEREGYKPVYDFSRVTKSKGTSEEGDYKVLEGKIGVRQTDGYRLPTKDEAEYFTRAGTTTKYSFGDDEHLLDQYGWFDKNSDDHTHPVGEKLPNPFGLYDVHGNVSEWVGDYQSSCVRGGSWGLGASGLRSAYHHGDVPEYRYSFVGFRLLRTPRHP